MGVLSNRISVEDLRSGDHVYSWRIAYTYSHHGIYVGDNKVIHFTRGKAESENNALLDLLLISSGYSKTTKACEACRHQQGMDGVICCCLDCFLDGGALYRFEYGVNPGFFLAKARGGTCTLAESDPPETVLHRATYLLQNGFGCYNVFKNNCEDFAVYCKTGLLVLDGLNVGSQAASILAAVAAVFSSPLRFLTTSIPGITAVAGGVYCFSRLAADIGNRKDAVKVPVESLTARLGVNDLPIMSSISAEPVLQVQM
ncbi:protein LEAD-SENSITIVE 1 [Cryptomeria japonica]|uniref:protein LEAD-SENSITIVE 1 n=1 Tax=Cryptomeria japonica TaxID=3369 RepID=UPI0025AD6D1F|nr:protein LEAD-SENSITIVE 1 [Cryptomeria japonica]